MGPPSVRPADPGRRTRARGAKNAVSNGSNAVMSNSSNDATNSRQGSLQPKILIQTLSSNNEIPGQGSFVEVPPQDSQGSFGVADPQNQQMPPQPVVPVPVAIPDPRPTEAGLPKKDMDVKKTKSSSSSEASLAGLNAALVHRLYDPADLVMQDDKGRRYSHRAIHYLGDRLEDTDLCFLTVKPRGLPADCTIKGNYVTVCRQNLILGPKGSQIEKVRLPVLKPEKTQSDEDNLLLLPGPSQKEAARNMVNPDDPEGYTAYLQQKAEWEKNRPKSADSNESKASDTDSQIIQKNVLRERLMKEKLESQAKSSSTTVQEPPPIVEEPQELQVPVEKEEIPEEVKEIEGGEKEPEPVVPEELTEKEGEKNIAEEGDGTQETGELPDEKIDDPRKAAGRMMSGGDIPDEELNVINEEIVEGTPIIPEQAPPEVVKPPEAPPRIPPPATPPKIKLQDLPKLDTENGKNTWLHNESDSDSTDYYNYGSGSSKSSKSKSKKSTKKSKRGDDTTESSESSSDEPENIEQESSQVVDETDQNMNYGMNQMGNGMMGMDPMMGAMNPMMSGIGMMHPMMNMMNPMMGGMNMNSQTMGMDNLMMGIMMGMLPLISQQSSQAQSPPCYPCYYPPPPCPLTYGYDPYYAYSSYDCPPPCYNKNPCHYSKTKPGRGKKCCKKSKCHCHKKEKNKDAHHGNSNEKKSANKSPKKLSTRSGSPSQETSKRSGSPSKNRRAPGSKRRKESRPKKLKRKGSLSKSPSGEGSRSRTLSNKSGAYNEEISGSGTYERSACKDMKIFHNTNQNLNREEDMNFSFLPQKGCCAEVTMTMEPDEPDPLLYAVTNGQMPIVCCQMPPTLMLDQQQMC